MFMAQMSFVGTFFAMLTITMSHKKEQKRNIVYCKLRFKDGNMSRGFHIEEWYFAILLL